MTATETKLTRAAFDALAWLHIADSHRPNLRQQTWCQISPMYDTGGKRGRCFVVKPEYVDLAESHRMVKVVRDLESQGWKVQIRDGQGRKSSRYIYLKKLGRDSVLKACVYVDGFFHADEDR